MKLSLTWRLYIGFAAAIILAASVGLVTYLTFNKQVNEAEWVTRTYDIINKAESLQKLMVDLEVGKRGYRSTGGAKFLQPFDNASKKIPAVIHDLTELIRDNPQQLEKVDNLKSHISELFDYWEKNPGSYLDLSQEDILRITSQEKDQMDRIRREVTEIIAVANQNLTIRQATSRDSIQVVSLEVAIGTLLTLIIIAVLIRVIVSEFKTRKKAEEELQENFKELEQLNATTKEKNTLLTGISLVDESLKGINEPSELAEKVLKTLVNFLGFPAGVFYLYEKHSEKQLRAAALFAVPAEGHRSYAIGEGLPGTAARGKDIVHITNIPAGYWNISSGIGSQKPGEILLAPIHFNGELEGVLEFATFDPIPESTIAFLKTVIPSIGVAINSADAREQILQLLEQVQHQNERMEMQQEELRQTNEELTNQAESLQASEEELRVQEEELRQINAELEERNEAVEIARQALIMKAQELETTGKYKSEFLANMSHELRTPLNSVLILAKLLSDNKPGTLTDKQREYAHIIHKSGNDLLNLINDILDLAKIEAGKVDFNIEPISVRQIATDMRQLFTVQADEKEIKFEVTIEEDTPKTLQTDKLRLEQVVKNLVSNALKFTPRSGEVSILFRKADELPGNDTTGAFTGISIEVKDTGIGIPPEKHEIIFEAFQQADGSTNRKFGGTGLGLSISKELAKKLGGDIYLQSEEGKGSTFTLIVPLDPANRKQQPVRKPSVQKTVTDMPDFSNMKEQTAVTDDRNDLAPEDKLMLVVEDDKKFAAILRDFARGKGYKTVVALQGDEGLYYAMKYKPQAIILDLMLPVISGKDVLSMLKNNDKLKHIPVHIISANDEQRYDLSEAIAFLHKPVGAEDLENAFDLIGLHLHKNAKNVLVLSGVHIKDNALQKMIDQRGVDMNCDYVHNATEAQQMLEKQKYSCIIADIGKEILEGITLLQQLQEQIKEEDTPVIIYLDKDISDKDELQLKKISDAIIRESSSSEDRLMDELELFLYKLQETEKTRSTRRMAMVDNDTILPGKKVLLVDDDMRNVFALSTLLEQQQMTVITANDGREAIEQLKLDSQFDLVLMDIMMPEMDGYEAMKHIRKDLHLDKLPIIALTAKAMPGDQEKCIQAGASDYITKPVDSNRLFSLMKVWLAQ